MLYYCPFARPPNQDRRHFGLGESRAKPAPGYFGDLLGLPDEQQMKDAVAGLSSPDEIEEALYQVFREDRVQARDYMKWRMGIKR